MMQLELIRIDVEKIVGNNFKGSYEDLLKVYMKKTEHHMIYRTSVRNRLLKKHNIKKETGIPDFCYEADGQIVFIECKGPDDTLRYTQLKWIFEHQWFRVRLIWVEPIFELEEGEGIIQQLAKVQLTMPPSVVKIRNI